MPAKPRSSRPKTPRQRMEARRARLRAQGFRPVQHWVPDLRDPRVRAEIRREAALLAKHPDNAAVDAWIESVYDWDEWK
ncbi:MAG: antitoxin MazE family protein [Burkholderiales bacterium]